MSHNTHPKNDAKEVHKFSIHEWSRIKKLILIEFHGEKHLLVINNYVFITFRSVNWWWRSTKWQVCVVMMWNMEKLKMAKHEIFRVH